MDKESVKSLLITTRMNNEFLGLVDERRKDKEIKLEEVLTEFGLKYGEYFDSYFFYNHYQFITSLLAYIVLPKEVFNKELPKKKLSDLCEKWGVSNSFYKSKEDEEKKICDSEVTLEYYIRCLRNAIAHGNIEVYEQSGFRFIDKIEGSIIKFNFESLQKFTQALAYWLKEKDIDLKEL